MRLDSIKDLGYPDIHMENKNTLNATCIED
jgi:hypothetical protein